MQFQVIKHVIDLLLQRNNKKKTQTKTGSYVCTYIVHIHCTYVLLCLHFFVDIFVI